MLILKEDPEAFAQFSARVHADLRPLDAVEVILVDDFISHAWVVRRWRRLEAGLLRAGSDAGMKKALTPLIGAEKADALAQGWAKGDRAKVAEVEQLMTSGLLSLDVALAESATTKVDIILHVDGLQATHETRMAASLRELDRYRAGAGKAARDIVEAEFEDVSGRGTSEGEA